MKNIFNSTLNNSFFKGGVILTISNFAVGFLNYIFNVLTGRALGPVGYGEIATLFSYLTVISIPMGIAGSLIVQKIGNSKNPEAFTISLYSWVIEKLKRYRHFIVVFILLTPFLPYVTNLATTTSYALSGLILLTVIGAFYSNAITALHMFVPQSIISFIGALLKLSGAIAVFFGFGNLIIVLSMILVSSIIQIGLTYFAITKKLNLKVEKSYVKIEKRIIDVFKDRQLWYTSGVTAVFTLLGNIDIIFVKRFFTPEEAGLFGAWSVFAKIILYVLGPLISLSFIFFSSIKYEKWHRLVFAISFLFLLLSGLVANLGYGLYRQEIINMLFGKEFMMLIPYMEWAGLFGIGYVMMLFMMQYFLAKKSKACLIPAVLFPVYTAFLFIYPKNIGDVMIVDTAYVFVSTILFLLFFFHQRFLHLLKIFK